MNPANIINELFLALLAPMVSAAAPGAVSPAMAAATRFHDGWPLLASLIKSGVILGVILSITGYIVLVERRVIAFLQHRVGPNRARLGFLPRTAPAHWSAPARLAGNAVLSVPNYLASLGLLQPLADVIKLLTKEDFTPPFVNKVLFTIAPAIIVVTALMALGLVPWGDPNLSPWFVVTNSNVGILLFLGLSSLGVYSIVLAGWSSNNKYAVLGGLRATAQMISYELSMGLALLAVVMLTGSFNMGEIVRQQSTVWNIVLQPVGFVVFLIAIVAESRRTPFDLPEAENELVAGFHTEYSSMKFAMFFLGEYIGVLLLSGITATVYLGGWMGPNMPMWSLLALLALTVQVWEWTRTTYPSMPRPSPVAIVLAGLAAVLFLFVSPFAVPGVVWVLAKMLALVFFFIWIRATYPRFRYDHLMDIGWKFLMPVALLNVVVTAFLALAFAGFAASR